ncbi:hypothetical protein COT97_02335 [Candidatus Falkowbacteria bacterium CG10_big_fil_rev_8_21_14_0_10_39_11]|uniref:Pseudouridine synthase n=1 Tax=Candidatus Falkowbacteria bacterium CG10_big_fil_rev_8_21_14_0_10_39_11 TaxID=1974565 RepID=A0A2H0V5B7_9BACT|nr:MAG: hypothetical protein COT97_02335 [Candidatus Falkowbacteria bacterium CG10_big_fil_rev_8_21_14_0_10_39_11]
MTNFFIRQKYIGERLDKYLVARLHITRNQAQKLIKNNQIKVNDLTPSVHHFLRTGDKVSIDLSQPKKTEVKTQKAAPAEFVAIPKVIKTNKDYYIINKPAGMLVHPTLRGENNTLIDWLLQFDPELKNVGEDPARPAIVHRLDKEVSGLIIIPRNLDAFDHFKNLFQSRTITKKYTALVHGVIEHEDGEITFPIIRSKSGKYVGLPQNSTEGQTAITTYKVTKHFAHYTLLEVKPKTGRTNQIRIHLNAIGHPIVGDPLYTNNKIKNKYKLKLNRVFLHATALEFTDLKNKKITLTLDLPAKLQTILDHLK